MDKNSVVFKGVPNGLLIILDDEIPFERLEELFLVKVKNSKDLLEGASLTVKFKGKELTRNQEKILINILLRESTLDIVEKKERRKRQEQEARDLKQVDSFGSIESIEEVKKVRDLKEADDVEEITTQVINVREINNKNNFRNFRNFKNFSPFRDRDRDKKNNSSKNSNGNKKNNNSNSKNNNLNISNIENSLDIISNNNNLNNFQKNITHFHKGHIRSGQKIEFNGTVVVIGDINPGGKIVATGNIIVLGKLRGVVHAGCSGDSSCFIVALYLRPTQLFISEIFTYFPNDLKRDIVPEYAYLRDGKIYIEQL